MEHHRCSFEQLKKVQDYFDYLEREQEGLNEEQLLNKAVPDHIKTSILIHITQSMVLNCDFFGECESGFLRQIMISLEQQFFGPNFMIMTSSTPVDGMFFIKKGVVEILEYSNNDDLRVTKILEVDESFAEGCLLEHWVKNPFLARSITDCELWFFSRSTFNRLVDDFPHVRDILRKSTRINRSTERRASIRTVSKDAEKARRDAAFFIHPDNFFIQFWFGLILLVTIYSIIAIPFRLSFMENHDISTTWLVLDYCGDVLLLVDIVIRAFFLAYYDDSHLFTSQNEIWLHYLKSGKLKWHLLSIFPFEIAMIKLPALCPLWKLQVWSLLRINKILRACEVRYLIHRVESSLAKAGVRVPKNTLRVGKLLIVMLLSAHMVACIFFLIANLNQHDQSIDLQDKNNWAYTEGLLDASPSCPGQSVSIHRMSQQYIAALYWSMATLTTVGYGDITAHENSVPEILFATVVLIIGTAIYTMVIALLEDIVSQLDVTSSLHKMKMDKVDNFLETQSLPDALKTKIIAYYEYLWRTQRGVGGKKLLGFLPRSFRVDITFRMLSPLLLETFFIKDCTANFIAHILDSVSFEIYLPGDIIYNEGGKCDTLFFICKGSVDLLTSKNVKFKTVSDCILGETSYFGLEPHICTAKAVDISEVFLLSMEVSYC